jgi:hypothetical protein
MASAYSARERARSVSSKRRMNRPAPRRANNQFNKRAAGVADVDAAVGEGAKRTIGVEDLSSS